MTADRYLRMIAGAFAMLSLSARLLVELEAPNPTNLYEVPEEEPARRRQTLDVSC